MNVIVTNKQKEIIDNANIDAIKDFNGLFNVDDLISKIKNYFYSKLILDATSIINFSSKDVLEKLVSSIGSDRLIILLPTELEPPQEFLNLLISLKIYNFSTKIGDIVRFINTPNTYENVVGITNQNIPDYYVDNSIKANDQIISGNNANLMYGFNGDTLTNPVIYNDNYQKDHLENNDVNNFSLQSNMNNNFQNYPNFDSSMNVVPNIGNAVVPNNFNEPKIFPNDNSFVSQNMNIPNQNFNNLNNSGNTFNNTFEPIITPPISNDNIVNNSNNEYIIGSDYHERANFYNQDYVTNGNVSNSSEIKNEQNDSMSNPIQNNQTGFYNNYPSQSKSFVLGFKNITLHAGSTTLIYLLMKAAREKLKLRVNAIEVNKQDFKYFSDNDMISATTDSLRNVIGSCFNANLILVDLNDYYGNFDMFDEVVYLVEPSVIRLNKLMMENKFAFRENSKNKLMLNMSLLKNDEVNALSNEAGVEFIMNIPPVNDRISNDIILRILALFGFK